MTTKRKHLKDMSDREIVSHLKAGRVVRTEHNDETFQLVDGILCRYRGGDLIDLGCSIEYTDPALYIDLKGPFKVDRTGMYMTRDGKRALVSYIRNDKDFVFPVYGVIEGDFAVSVWTRKGRSLTDSKDPDDLVAKLEG